MYNQDLYKVVNHIKTNTINRLNKSKKWKYGYNKEHDVVVISKTGMIGEVYISLTIILGNLLSIQNN